MVRSLAVATVVAALISSGVANAENPGRKPTTVINPGRKPSSILSRSPVTLLQRLNPFYNSSIGRSYANSPANIKQYSNQMSGHTRATPMFHSRMGGG